MAAQYIVATIGESGTAIQLEDVPGASEINERG